MKLTKSSTSEIFFIIDPNKENFREQDFIIIEDIRDSKSLFFLGRIETLVQSQSGEIKGNAEIIGEINFNNFTLTPCNFPISHDAIINLPEEGIVSKILSSKEEESIYLGDIVTSFGRTEPFLIPANFIERHVLCVASTGAGKSYCIGVLLEEIMLKSPSAAVILFDIHFEYWGLCFPNKEYQSSIKKDGYSSRAFYDNVLIFSKSEIGLNSKFSLERLRRLLDLTSAQENSLINIVKEPLSLIDLKNNILDSDLHPGTRDNLISKITTLINLDLFEKELEITSLVSPGQISIVRLDEFVDDKKRQILVSEILTKVFLEKIQGRIEKDQEIIFVIEEAHRFSMANEIITRMSREGRKFGIYSILISQRPADFPDDIIANMNTLIALRIKSDKDLTKIRLMEGISNNVIASMPHLNRGEAIIFSPQTKIQQPIKIKVRQRMTKHINPQVDSPPTSLPYFSKKLDRSPQTTKLFDSKDENETMKDVLAPLENFDAKDLSNLLAMNHVILLHKKTGICLYELGTTMLEIDPQLVSGFLTAISGLFSELKSQKGVKDRTKFREFTEELGTGDQAFKIFSVEGKYSVSALILSKSPKYPNRLKQRLKNFVYSFETKFSSFLENFMGVLDDFSTVNELLDQHLGLAILTPLKLNEGIQEESIHTSLCDIILKELSQLATTEGVFLEEIVNICLLNSEYNYREILEAIASMFMKGIVILTNKNRKLPQMSSKSIESHLDILSNGFTQEDEAELRIDQVSREDPEWFEQIITSIQPNPLQNAVKMDILKRDLIFESNYRVNANTLRIDIYSLAELQKWARIMDNKGFTIQEMKKNPINGQKITFQSGEELIICSIAFHSDKDYIFAIASVHH
ncbi:ATP-binding protein [Candidatus Hodarchaeum mangrovi]